MELEREAQLASDASANQQEQRDIADAQGAAKAAYDLAKGHYESARDKATAARAQATAARGSANMAMAARTNYMSADMAADEAEAAATAAEAARDLAEAAMNAAKMAYENAMDAETSMAAEAAQTEAENQNRIAEANHTGENGAGPKYMEARDAAIAAAEAAGEHVLGLLITANAVNVMDETPATDENEAQAAYLMLSATAVGTAAGEDDNGEDGTTATATWPGVVDDPGTANVDESADSVLSIMVDPEGSGTPMAFRTEAVEDDPATTGIDESAPKTVTVIAGLGDFDGFSIDDGNRHAIVFTDRTQDDAPVTAVTAVPAASLVRDPVSGSTVTDLGTQSGTGYTGVTYYDGVGTVDDNTDTNLAFTGSLTCPDATACSATTNADGTINVEGYVFTGSRAATDAVTAMDAAAQVAANQDYLVFGVWLHEDGDGNTTADDPQFGAFANGGSAVTDLAVEITGTATYEGSATGVYTAGESVDYFQGDAMLEADFGANDAQGTITGMIDNIVAGGNTMTDVIHLNSDDTPDDGNMVAAGTFSGNARMGTATTVDAVTTYSHNGNWSGQFFNGTADDTTTTVNESHVAPGSVAGTFGVTGMTGTGDDAVTRSYVGAFGAHLDD